MSASGADPGVAATWHMAGGRAMVLDRPHIIGILNVTPDSFSDGGRFVDPGRATARALEMIDHGASVIDVGGESTRPGARRVPVRTQCDRVLPVIRRLCAQSDIRVSIDTTRAAVARAAIDAGACIVNDVSAGTEDDAMFELVAERDAGIILMHRLVPPEVDSYSDRYDTPPAYDDVVAGVRTFLKERIDRAITVGVRREAIVVDPGLGFGKTVEQNLTLAAAMSDIGRIGDDRFPVLSACSRKSFIGRISGEDDPARRIAGTLAMSVAHALAGVRLFRVHDIAPHREALQVAAAILQARGE